MTKHYFLLAPFVLAMAVIVVSSNILVAYPINEYLTFGAFTYPFSFLCSDLTVRALGAGRARQSIYISFVIGVIMSLYLADISIAIASGSAFLIGQILDILVFNKLRQLSWWQAPLASGFLSSMLDTILFFGLAFVILPPFMAHWGMGGDDFSDFPVLTLAIGDYSVKVIMILLGLLPYKLLLNKILEYYK